MGFGLLGATFVAGVLQLWAGGLTGVGGAGESVKRAAIAAGALVSYPVVLEKLLVGTNVLTAQMIRHPLVEDGLDKAFGAALVVGAVTGGLSLGLAVGAALVVLYFTAALIVLKLGLTTALSVAHLAGALVWGVYALPQTAWLARAWTAAVVAAIVVPIAWACVFAAAALLAADTLVFDGGGRHNNVLGDALSYLVKPLAAVACFWLAYRAPGFLLGLARSAGLGGVVTGRAPFAGGGAPAPGGASTSGRRPEDPVRQGVQTNADRFRALTQMAGRRLPMMGASASATVAGPSPGASASTPAEGHGRVPAGARAAAAVARPLVRANRWWRELPARAGNIAEGEAAGPGARAAAKPPGRSGGGGRARASATPASARRATRETREPQANVRVQAGLAPAAGMAQAPRAHPPRGSRELTPSAGTAPSAGNAATTGRRSPSAPARRAGSAPARSLSPVATSARSTRAARTSSRTSATGPPVPPAPARRATTTSTAGSSTHRTPDAPAPPSAASAPAAPHRTHDRHLTSKRTPGATPAAAPASRPARPPAPSVRATPPAPGPSAAPRPPHTDDPPRRRP